MSRFEQKINVYLLFGNNLLKVRCYDVVNGAGVNNIKLEADLHMHTVACGHGYSTVKELAEAATEQGLKMIAVTEHGPAIPGAPHMYFYENLNRIPSYLFGVEVLKGVEANIVNVYGYLDLPENLLDHMDIVLAGFHARTGMDGLSVEENTAAMINAIKNPHVHVITHPGNPNFPVNIEKVVLAARDNQKALEINNSSFSASRPGSTGRCRQFARLVKKYDGMVVLNSDAHVFSEVGRCRYAVRMAVETGLDGRNVLNTSTDRVREYLYMNKKRLQENRVLPA